jgi:hypothetical protein
MPFQIDDEDGISTRRKKQKKGSKEGAELKGGEVSQGIGKRDRG